MEKIAHFIDEHHVMSLASSDKNGLSVCSLFYVFDKVSNSFVVASSNETLHVRQIKQNPLVAGNILLETKSIGKIQGLQFSGEFVILEESDLKKLYYKAFPYAIALNPTLWQIRVNYFKMTDNRLGFGKKIIWQESNSL